MFKKENKNKPFTKWVGGKRQILPKLLKYIPKKFNNYYEPFVDGGALFFELQPKTAIINDYNKDLISSYKTIKDDVFNLIEELNNHKINNSKEYYYYIREFARNDKLEKLSDKEK